MRYLPIRNFGCAICACVLKLFNSAPIAPVSYLTYPRDAKASLLISCGNTESKTYEDYNHAETPEESRSTATKLVEHLNNKRQEKWIQTISKIDFTHSSSKAWKTMNSLTGKTSAKKACPISPNLIADQVIKTESFPTQTNLLPEA